ncbi:hypothetical protein [Prevotella sp. C561]|nr:hypothetical protein [Prevotella sp. C561]
MELIQRSSVKELPQAYAKKVFSYKTHLILNYSLDRIVQDYGWIS